jgi:DNA-binding CsgD family transcriptional regulator
VTTTSAVLVGRDRELTTVRGLVDAVSRGTGGTLLVTGEAGIGKSRLLAEAVARARETGLLVVSGRAVEGGGTYRPIAEALASLPLDAAPDPSSEALRPYRQALSRLLPGWSEVEAAVAGDRPPTVDPLVVLGEGVLRHLTHTGGCLVVLEDLHWADADTLALVDYLAGRAPAWPILLALSARDDEAESQAVRALAAGSAVTAVRLRRLTPANVLALAAHCAGDTPLPDEVRRLLIDKSDGLPFLVEELVAALRDADAPARLPVPPTLAGLVANRLAALSFDDQRVLQAAAIGGDDPEWTVLASVTGLDGDAVLRALRAAHPQLLVVDGDRLNWRHALTRSAVAASIVPPERAALAARTAEALLDRCRDDDEARAAELLLSAGERDRAATLFLRLAKREMPGSTSAGGLAGSALRSAERLLDRAAAAAAPSLRPAVAIARVRLLTLRGKASAAIDDGVGALDGASGTPATGDEHAELCLRLAQAAIVARRWDEATRFLDRAGRPDDPRALVLAAAAAFGAGDLVRAAELARSAAGRAEADSEWEPLCLALLTTARCAARSDLEAAASGYRRAAQLAGEHGLLPVRVTALIGLATVELAERPRSPALAEARELAVDAGLLADVIWADMLVVDGIFLVDGPRAAEALARDTAQRAGDLALPALQAVAELYMAASRAASADVDGMAAMLDVAAGRPDVPVEVAAAGPAIAAIRQVMAHDLASAAELLDAGLAPLLDHPETGPVSWWGLWALVGAVTGSDADALVRATPAARWAVNRGALEYADAVRHGRAGRRAEAAERFAEGDRTLDGFDWWRRLLRLLVLEAAIVDGWAGRGEGSPVPLLRADLAVYERTGEPELARTCRDLLRRAGAPTRRGRGSSPVPEKLRAVGVTSREMDVLRLVANGLTNRQIAQRLFLSPRTVDTHVANLLAKTGSGSRTELATLSR